MQCDEALSERENRRRKRIEFRASSRYQWHWAPHRIAGTSWQVATASDPEGMLREACRRQDAGEAGVIDPFWATVWRAAAGLDCFLARYPLNGIRVLELGCGTGRAGLSAALRGAEVTLTDGVSDPLLLVQLTTAALQHRCRVRRLRFGVDRLRGEPRFPLILGSDVTYLRHLWPELQSCVLQHLCEDGELLLSDPYRPIANDFREYIVDQGWRYEEYRIVPDDRQDHPIRVMRLRQRVAN
jgi:predicted nicotinamide N-methyase